LLRHVEGHICVCGYKMCPHTRRTHKQSVFEPKMIGGDALLLYWTHVLVTRCLSLTEIRFTHLRNYDKLYRCPQLERKSGYLQVQTLNYEICPRKQRVIRNNNKKTQLSQLIFTKQKGKKLTGGHTYPNQQHDEIQTPSCRYHKVSNSVFYLKLFD